MISVVIPTRHRNESLAQCLDCLTPGRQTLGANEYEVIVTDDGAESTAEQMIARQYPWARWTAGPRRGPAANRNNGARLANGDWIAFTDDDCLPAPTWLAGYAAAFRDGVDVYEGKTTCSAGLTSPIMAAPINLTGGWLWSCNMLLRRSLFEMLHGFDDRFPFPHMEDVDFRERLRARHIRFVFVPEAVVDHPPRSVALWVRRARIHECNVILERLWNRQPLGLVRFLRFYAEGRLRQSVQSRFSLDHVVSIASIAVEMGALVRLYPAWLKKYPKGRLLPHSEAIQSQDAIGVDETLTGTAASK